MCFPFWNQFLLVLETRMCVIQYSYNIQYEANLIGQLTKNCSVFHLLLHASMILTPDNKWFHWNLWFWVTPRQQHLVNHNLHTGPRQLNLVGISESHPFHPTVFFSFYFHPTVSSTGSTLSNWSDSHLDSTVSIVFGGQAPLIFFYLGLLSLSLNFYCCLRLLWMSKFQPHWSACEQGEACVAWEDFWGEDGRDLNDWWPCLPLLGCEPAARIWILKHIRICVCTFIPSDRACLALDQSQSDLDDTLYLFVFVYIFVFVFVWQGGWDLNDWWPCLPLFGWEPVRPCLHLCWESGTPSLPPTFGRNSWHLFGSQGHHWDSTS